MAEIIDLFLHLDRHLAAFVVEHGAWVYGLLFVIVFCETGLVVTPFLPGDSLLFGVGALGASGALNAGLAAILMFAAAILGNTSNYHIGKYVGPRIFTAEDPTSFWQKLMNRKHLAKAHDFFERHGGKAVMMAQFMPIVRTFVPFVAGAGAMTYPKFIFYNITGALVWVSVCVGAGYAFGNLPFVKQNFSLIVLGIIFVSLIPLFIQLLKSRRAPEPLPPG